MKKPFSLLKNKVSGFFVPKIERRNKFECKNNLHMEALFSCYGGGHTYGNILLNLQIQKNACNKKYESYSMN